MMETDDKLLRDFFATEKKEIADNGFSRRVMRHLPSRRNHLAEGWTVFITLVALILFLVFDGLQAVIETLRDGCVSIIQSGASSIDPKSLIIVIVVLTFLGIRRIWAMV